MRLKKFKVTNFRSVGDSGWIDVDLVTALIGINESGKTNLLVPLWKLNPAREGDIQPTSDYPKKKFGEIRENPSEFRFITAEFETDTMRTKLAKVAEISEEEAEIVQVSRSYDGSYDVKFPNFNPCSTESLVEDVQRVLGNLKSEIASINALKKEENWKLELGSQVSKLLDDVVSTCEDANYIVNLEQTLNAAIPIDPPKTSKLVRRVRQTVDELQTLYEELTLPDPGKCEDVVETVLEVLPKFVYYSNYGNLDSEIYLPHVVDNLNRNDLGTKEEAKARTLRVLFSFVKLSAKEILQLGLDFDETSEGREPSNEEIEKVAESKRERSILLQSAETSLTSQFKDWWQQGDYRFELQADGNHFRIWVSDDRRPEKIELENRSTGLQWFLSFFLVFLVESQREHRNAVLLLDEPGLSLHPLAQRDLSAFFDNLSKTNGIIYTAHSPFLVDADRIDRVRKVYIANDGTTKATSNLRHIETGDDQPGAAYAVFSALGLTVAESLLVGCAPVIVEGASDQHYLSAIKTLLIAGSKISPRRELVFPPAGGAAKPLRVVASVLMGRDNELPVVLLDGDSPGKSMAKILGSGLYEQESNKVLCTDDFVRFKQSEVEDLIPVRTISNTLDRWQRRPAILFGDVVEEGAPIVPQIEMWANTQGITLPAFWKVELAKRVKKRILDDGIDCICEKTIENWQKLFNAFEQQNLN